MSLDELIKNTTIEFPKEAIEWGLIEGLFIYLNKNGTDVEYNLVETERVVFGSEISYRRKYLGVSGIFCKFDGNEIGYARFTVYRDKTVEDTKFSGIRFDLIPGYKNLSDYNPNDIKIPTL